MERHRSGDGYKNISKTLDIPWSTVKTIIKKWKAYGPMKTLPRSGRPSKLDDQARRTDQRSHQETNGKFERPICLYGKDWSLCACDNNIPSIAQVWPVRRPVARGGGWGIWVQCPPWRIWCPPTCTPPIYALLHPVNNLVFKDERPL